MAYALNERGYAMGAEFDLAGFGKRLREVRKKKKLTLKDVYTATEISVPTLSRIERADAKEIESKTLFILATWANLDLEFFQGKQRAKRGVTSATSTPDAVELHLRADKNLDSRAAELLIKMFRAAYDQAANES